MRRKVLVALGAVVVIAAIGGAVAWLKLRPTADDVAIALSCAELAKGGLRDLADDRTERFQGKVAEETAKCRGGDGALAVRETPWVDWADYWGAGDLSSQSDFNEADSHLFNRNIRGVDGALLDLEYQRMELIKFNLFDNRTFEEYAADGGQVRKVWEAMRLSPDDLHIAEVEVGEDGSQTCQGEAIRFRTLTGICNDIRNPAMGSTGQLFARNAEFESTFPDRELNELAKNRHGGRISLLQPDPQVISRRLFTRDQTDTPDCNQGQGVAGSPSADCAYKKAPFFNVLAAFWIQFMTHDWFAHPENARNDQSKMMSNLGCVSERKGEFVVPLSSERVAELGCRTGDKMEASLVADASAPATFDAGGSERIARSYQTSQNFVTAWWDASQLYGFDERSRTRVKRDPEDPAKILLQHVETGGAAADPSGYLPEFSAACPPDASGSTGCDQIQPEWTGQEAAAFPDYWSVGMSFYHNVFAREHNAIVDEFRKIAAEHPDDDSGLRNPARPDEAIAYGKISDDELFEVARLIVAAEIAKIHTIEWTPQLLYDEPLYIGMNSNWSGLFEADSPANRITKHLVERLGQSEEARKRNQLYSAFAAGAGIVGRRQQRAVPVVPSKIPDDRSLEFEQPGRRQRRHQSLRLAVQFPRGVRLGLSAARAAAGHDRASRHDAGSERHRGACADHRHIPRQGHRRDASGRLGELGA